MDVNKTKTLALSVYYSKMYPKFTSFRLVAYCMMMDL